MKDIGPMGVSQWRDHGKMYGYDKYYNDKVDSLSKAVVECWFGTKNRAELLLRLEDLKWK